MTARILYISHVRQGKGGDWVHASQFTKAAKRLGFELTPHPPLLVKPEQSAAKESGEEGFRGGLFNDTKHFGASLLKRLPGEWRAVRANRPDVILLRFDDYLSSILLCKLYRLPLVIEMNGPEVEESQMLPSQSRYRFEGLWRSYFRYMLRKAAHIVTVSEPLRQHVIETGIPGGQVTTVPNGVDIDAFAPAVGTRNVRSDLGLKGKVVLGFSGFFSPWHGIDFAAEGMRQLAGIDRGSPESGVVLLLVGKAQGFTSMPSLQGTAVVSTGYVAHREMPAYLDAIDIFIAPYPKIEPFYFSPLKILEAMAMGKPVVASNQGQIGELITHGENGLLYPPGDMPAFLECLRTLIADGALRERMGRRGREIAAERYTWEHNARAVLGVCERAMRESRASREEP